MILLRRSNIVIFALVFILFSCKKPENKEWVDLLNYTDFSNWSHFVLKPEQKGVEESEMQYPPEWLIPKVYLSDNPDSAVFSYQMHEGKKVLHISGELIGFLTSKEEYSNYHLKYKFKFGKKWQWLGDRPRDGGIFYHVVNPASDKEQSPHELNIHDGDIGSYWSFGGYGDIPSMSSTDLPESITSIIPILKPVIPSLKDTMYLFDPAGTLRTFNSSIPNMQVAVANPIADNSHGEWNEIDLICLGDTVIHAVNGKVVAVLYNSRYEAEGGGLVPLTKGAIKIQSEGGEQFVEYIRIKKIAEIPEEFRSGLTSFEISEDAVYLSIMYPELFCAAGSMGGELNLDNSQLKAAIGKAIPLWEKLDYGFYLVNGDGDQPDAFKDFGNILAAEGIDCHIIILPDTDHNLGDYYERSVSTLLTFLFKHIKY